MKKLCGLICVLCVNQIFVFAQVDTSYLYNPNTPYGTLDIRIAKSPTQYYYLDENKTISYRENPPGVRTDTYLSLLSWNTSDYTEGNLRERSGVADYFIMNYRLLFPENYIENYEPGYPIMIMMHGLGERGNCWDDKCYHADRNWNYNTNDPPAPTDSKSLLLNNDLNLLNGGGVHLTARNLAGDRLPDAADMPDRAFPGFVLFPQNLNGWTGNTVQDVIKTIRLMIKKYNIDEDRIYIHGISNGGAGTFEALKRAPWLFACALTMSPISDASINSQGMAGDVAHIPMWIFQGGKDKGPTPTQTENHVKDFRNAGTVVRYYLYPELGHGTWNTAYKEPDYFTWTLSKNKSDIHTFAGNTAICRVSSDGVKMELAKGFFKYQWQKNGVTIPGATGPSYKATSPGEYRARFSRVANPTEEQWNQWSAPVTITEQESVPQAEIEQIGTVVLPDLNGLNEAQLKATGDYAHYYWYKDDGLLNFDGDMDDTLNYVTINSSYGDGSYTLVTAQYSNCPSPASEPKYIFFDDRAPVNIAAPTDFKGRALSLGVQLSWNDVSDNEDGFEIWNRKFIASSSSFSPWALRVLTAPNTTSYTDKGLEPLVSYQYKIRAVSNSGRSNYTPEASDEYLEIKTVEDTSPPGAPRNLTARITSINTALLSWDAPEDDVGIKRYHIYFGSESVQTDSTQLSTTISNLNVNTIYHFKVKAEDLGGNLSEGSNSATVSTYVTGLYYEHSTGVWNSLDEVDWSLVEFSGYIHNFSLAPKTQDDYFNFKFDGYIQITTPGEYQFSTVSDDGSRIILDHVEIVNNDGIHDQNEVVSENLTLTAGPKRITVTFFDFTGTDTLAVKYRGPDTGGEWMMIPDEVLRSGNPPPTKSMIVTAYPNPTGHQDINLVLQYLDNTPLSISLVDYLGQIVYQRVISADQFWGGIKITPPEDLNSGLYLLTVKQNQSSGQCKILITDK